MIKPNRSTSLRRRCRPPVAILVSIPHRPNHAPAGLPPRLVTRRGLLLAGAALAVPGCSHKRSPRYQGYALIANRDGRNVAFIDLSRFQMLKEIPVDLHPEWVFAAANHPRAYVLGSAGGAVVSIDLDSLEVAPAHAIPGRPRAARLSPDGGTLWIASAEPNRLVAINMRDGAWLTHRSLPAAPGDIDLAAGQVAVAFPAMRAVGRLNLANGAWQISSALPVAPNLVRFRADGKTLFACCPENRTLVAFDSATLARMVDLALPLSPAYVCFNGDGGQMFLSGPGMDAVTIVSPYQTEVGETILAGSSPGAMAASTGAPQYLFVANPGAGQVTVINIDTRKVLAQIAVGQQPAAIVLTPDNEYALVLNQQSGDLAVIRLMSIRNADLISRRARTGPLFTMVRVGSGPVSAAVVPRNM